MTRKAIAVKPPMNTTTGAAIPVVAAPARSKHMRKISPTFRNMMTLSFLIEDPLIALGIETTKKKHLAITVRALGTVTQFAPMLSV